MFEKLGYFFRRKSKCFLRKLENLKAKIYFGISDSEFSKSD